MKNKILSLLLVGALMMTPLAGCGQSEQETASGNVKESEKVGASSEKETEEAKVVYEDLPTLTILANHGYAYESEENQVWRAVAEKVGAKIHILGADTDKFNAMIASGEGYDIVWASQKLMPSISAGDALLELDDLVKDYPNLNSLTECLSYSKETFGNNSGALCWLFGELYHNGEAAGTKDAVEGHIRWDLYADMGYPETDSVDEYLQMLADMLAANPTNEAGEKVYGMTIPSDRLLMTFQQPFDEWNGRSIYQKTATYDWEDMSYENMYGENGIFWDGVDFFHKAYLMGLLDPDAFTATEEDLRAKATAGRLLFINRYYQVGVMSEGQGFSAVPVNWASSGATETTASSKVTFKYGMGINKKSDKIDLCLKYLDFATSEEGANLILNGFEGVHYTIDENGVRSLTDEGLALYKDQEAWGKTGLGTTEIAHFSGLAKDAIASDGKTMLLPLDKSYFVGTLTDVQKDFCKYFGVEYPAQAFIKIEKENGLPNPSTIDGMVKNFLPIPTDEIAQLESAVENEASNFVADLVLASEDEYVAKVKAAKEKLARVGVARIDEWYEANWQSAFDKAKAYK